jgi:uncharacterized protein (TIGR00730 family)
MMPASPRPPRKKYQHRNQELNIMIHNLIEKAGGSPNADLIEEMIVTALRVQEGKIDRGDIKILNTALKELRYAFKVYEPYRTIRKVAVFGSARTPESSPDYRLARDFARIISKKGWMVITGAASGIMKAGNEGAGTARSFGANIRLPFEQSANPYILNDPKLISFKYFFTRKLIFIKESDATVLFPGGFGTHDEGFETLTLVQTGKAHPRPIICMDHRRSRYWKSLRSFLERQLAKTGMIDKHDLSLIHFTHDPREAAQIIDDFYSNYHSSRFIRDRFVLRIKKTLSEKRLAAINKRFRDIVTRGEIIQQFKPFAEEMDEPSAAGYTRLVFYFDRRRAARLHQLIRELK